VLGNRDIASGCDCSRRRRCGGRRRVRRGRESGDAPAQRRGRPPPMVATPAAPISSPPRPAALPTSPSTRSAASSLPRGQEPLGLPPSAQLPRRHRGGDLLLQARIWRRSLHLARTGPLQGLHLVRRRGVQSGAVRPAQTGLAAPDCKPMKNRQIRSPSTARLPIPVQVVATNARNAPVAHRAHIVSPVLRRCKNAPLWTPTRLI